MQLINRAGGRCFPLLVRAGRVRSIWLSVRLLDAQIPTFSSRGRVYKRERLPVFMAAALFYAKTCQINGRVSNF